MKLLLRILSWVAGVIVLVSVVLVVVNLFDEDPDPEAQAALDRSFTVQDAENGFFVVAGMYAPAGQDAHDYGKSLVSRWSREDAKPRLERDYGRELNASTIAGLIRKFSPREWCDWNEQQCLNVFVEHRQQIEQAAGAGAELLLRYLKIQRYPAYQDYISGTVETPMPPYLGIIWAAGVRNAQCALLVRDGNTDACLEMLQQDVSIARKMLSGGRTVLGKMAAADLRSSWSDS